MKTNKTGAVIRGVQRLVPGGGSVASVLAGRPPSRASLLPQGIGFAGQTRLAPIKLWELACLRWGQVSCICVGWQAAFAGKPAPKGDWVCRPNQVGTDQTVGAGLPAMGAGQLHLCWLAGRLRGQARSHRGLGLQAKSGSHRSNCGSWLACESGGSAASVLTDRPPSPHSNHSLRPSNVPTINSTITCTACASCTWAFTASHTWRCMLSASNPGSATRPRSKLLM